MNQVPPASGTRPIPMKPGTKVASDEATRTSQAHASDSPAPAQAPLIAASTGFSSARIARTLGWYVCFEGLSDAARQLLELAKILARAETASGAREDDCANRGIRRLGECRSEPLVHRPVDRVVDVRAVERDRENRAFA